MKRFSIFTVRVISRGTQEGGQQCSNCVGPLLMGSVAGTRHCGKAGTPHPRCPAC